MADGGFTNILYRLSILLLLLSCSTGNNNGSLIYCESNPEAGFNFPYFLFIPSGADTTHILPLVVEPNNSGFVSDNFDEHVEKAKRTASKEFYTGNYVAQKLKIPLLVPVFPRSESEWNVYTHAYDRDLALQNGNKLERADLQLLAMIEDARQLLEEKGYTIDETFFMTGFSASGTFVNRFTAIHPEKIKAAAAGGLNGLLILPFSNNNGYELNFPIGVNDFSDLFDIPFNKEAFKNTPQYWYMGESDDNDAIPYDDGYSQHEREIVYSILGKEMQPLRWTSCRKIYEGEDISATFKTYPGYGHEQPDEIKDDIVKFFKDLNAH